MSAKTHLDILNARISSQGAQTFYKPLQKDATGSLGWKNVTYSEFGKDVDAVAAHFLLKMRAVGAPDRAVVGLRLHGLDYPDIVHLYALCRAGYIPDMITTALTSPEVVLELLRESDAKALLHIPDFWLPEGCGIPTFNPVSKSDFHNLAGDFNFPSARPYNPDDVAFIQYTSGSTTNPKTVRCTNKWFQSVYNSWTSVWNPVNEGDSQDVFTLPGSVCQPSGFHALCIGIHLGGVFIQTSQSPGNPLFSASELVQLAQEGGLNRLNTFAPLMIPHILAAQAQLKSGDDTILRVLRGMRSIVYGGMPMLPVFEDWGYENKLPMMNTLGTTETGPLLHSNFGHHPRHMVPFRKIDLDFEPQAKSSELEGEVDRDLFALAVLPTSANIPHADSCRRDNGRFYTGDLFTRNDDGTWTHRGRNGDWIKVGTAYLIDTKTIEEHLKTTCSDLIKELVIVGTYRPAIALLAESAHPNSAKEMKDTIIQRLVPFHSRRMPWERLSAQSIVFLPYGSLPRTSSKGNVVRAIAEKLFAKEIDELFA